MRSSPPRERKRSDIEQKKKRAASAAKKNEVYGFVLWISTFVAYLCFLLWAFLPEHVLQSAGVTYYPSKWWAIGLPAYLCVLVMFIVVAYIGYNMYNTNPLSSRYTITDSFARPLDPSQPVISPAVLRARLALLNASSDSGGPSTPEPVDEYSVPEIADIPIETVNRILFHRVSTQQSAAAAAPAAAASPPAAVAPLPLPPPQQQQQRKRRHTEDSSHSSRHAPSRPHSDSPPAAASVLPPALPTGLSPVDSSAAAVASTSPPLFSPADGFSLDGGATDDDTAALLDCTAAAVTPATTAAAAEREEGRLLLSSPAVSETEAEGEQEREHGVSASNGSSGEADLDGLLSHPLDDLRFEEKDTEEEEEEKEEQREEDPAAAEGDERLVVDDRNLFDFD